ncbi:MAG TPA: tetratricopeptide repeat protein [Longimicrobiales bacterium]|nr:tetratricopeptide repeat protein [Longimicrobiales bacterium]
MKQPAQADMQRWSEEVARDPRSLAFLPLARAYRKQGLRDASLQLCLRGLEAYPSHVEAHGLLAMLYLDTGDHQRAADEWSMVLRVDPDNFEALRGMGFCYLEQDRLSRARQMLERAALLRPSDPTVQEALRVLGTRQEIAEKGLSSAPDVAFGDDPWAATSDGGPVFMLAPAASAEEAEASAANAGTENTQPQADVPPRAPRAVPVTGPVPLDPMLLFDDLLSAGPLLGALLVDVKGLVLAGRLTEAMRGDPAVLGAVLGGAIGEATRTAHHLALGTWRGILLDSEHALLHLAPAGSDAVMVLAARRDAPAGWMLRASAHAIGQAQLYMEEYA